MLKTSIVLHVTLIRIFEMGHYLYGFDHIYCIGCTFEVQCPPVKKGGAVKASRSPVVNWKQSFSSSFCTVRSYQDACALLQKYK